MKDGFSILSPAGFVMDVDVVAPRGGPGTYGGVVVSQLLPGAAIQVRGVGDFPLQPGQFLGRQGTIVVNCTAGIAGSAQAVVFLALSPTILLGIALDAANKPYVVIYDISGSLVGQATIPVSYTAGTPLTMEFAWNSDGVVYDYENAAFQVNNHVAEFYPDVSAWNPFIPTNLWVGTSFGALGLVDFTGSIGKVQVSDEVIFTVVPGAVIEEEEILSGSATMPGDSSVTASIDRIFSGASTMPGDSSQTAGATVTYAAGSTMGGDSGVTADATVTTP